MEARQLLFPRYDLSQHCLRTLPQLRVAIILTELLQKITSGLVLLFAHVDLGQHEDQIVPTRRGSKSALKHLDRFIEIASGN